MDWFEAITGFKERSYHETQWLISEQDGYLVSRHSSRKVAIGEFRFRRMRSLQKFAAVHASGSNHFNRDRSLSSRPHFKASRNAALTEWRGLCAE